MAGGQTLLNGQVSVATVATAILPFSDKRFSGLIYNAGAATIYLGDAGVTTSTGFPLLAGQSWEGTTQAAIYGIVASSTVTAAYIVESE